MYQVAFIYRGVQTESHRNVSSRLRPWSVLPVIAGLHSTAITKKKWVQLEKIGVGFRRGATLRRSVKYQNTDCCCVIRCFVPRRGVFL